ncbi:hypothetical protein C8R46DRAFT_1024542 [Mycena filopes]|nr:hypothetical protein C8R46DRAFT_1024542 [Mycena filopes]
MPALPSSPPASHVSLSAPVLTLLFILGLTIVGSLVWFVVGWMDKKLSERRGHRSDVEAVADGNRCASVHTMAEKGFKTPCRVVIMVAHDHQAQALTTETTVKEVLTIPATRRFWQKYGEQRDVYGRINARTKRSLPGPSPLRVSHIPERKEPSADTVVAIVAPTPIPVHAALPMAHILAAMVDGRDSDNGSVSAPLAILAPTPIVPNPGHRPTLLILADMVDSCEDDQCDSGDSVFLPILAPTPQPCSRPTALILADMVDSYEHECDSGDSALLPIIAPTPRPCSRPTALILADMVNDKDTNPPELTFAFDAIRGVWTTAGIEAVSSSTIIGPHIDATPTPIPKPSSLPAGPGVQRQPRILVDSLLRNMRRVTKSSKASGNSKGVRRGEIANGGDKENADVPVQRIRA